MESRPNKSTTSTPIAMDPRSELTITPVDHSSYFVEGNVSSFSGLFEYAISVHDQQPALALKDIFESLCDSNRLGLIREYLLRPNQEEREVCLANYQFFMQQSGMDKEKIDAFITVCTVLNNYSINLFPTTMDTLSSLLELVRQRILLEENQKNELNLKLSLPDTWKEIISFALASSGSPTFLAELSQLNIYLEVNQIEYGILFDKIREWLELESTLALEGHNPNKMADQLAQDFNYLSHFFTKEVLSICQSPFERKTVNPIIEGNSKGKEKRKEKEEETNQEDLLSFICASTNPDDLTEEEKNQIKNRLDDSKTWEEIMPRIISLVPFQDEFNAQFEKLISFLENNKIIYQILFRKIRFCLLTKDSSENNSANHFEFLSHSFPEDVLMICQSSLDLDLKMSQTSPSTPPSTTMSSSYLEQLEERKRALKGKEKIKRKRDEDNEKEKYPEKTEESAEPDLKRLRLSEKNTLASFQEPAETLTPYELYIKGIKEKLKQDFNGLIIKMAFNLEDFQKKFVHGKNSGKALHIMTDLLGPVINRLEEQLKEWKDHLEKHSHENESIKNIILELYQLKISVNDFPHHAGSSDYINYNKYKAICKMLDVLMLKILCFCEEPVYQLFETQEEIEQITDEEQKRQLLNTAKAQWQAITAASDSNYLDYPFVVFQYHFMAFFQSHDQLNIEEIKAIRERYINLDPSWLSQILKLIILNNDMVLYLSLVTGIPSNYLPPTIYNKEIFQHIAKFICKFQGKNQAFLIDSFLTCIKSDPQLRNFFISEDWEIDVLRLILTRQQIHLLMGFFDCQHPSWDHKRKRTHYNNPVDARRKEILFLFINAKDSDGLSLVLKKFKEVNANLSEIFRIPSFDDLWAKIISESSDLSIIQLLIENGIDKINFRYLKRRQIKLESQYIYQLACKQLFSFENSHFEEIEPLIAILLGNENYMNLFAFLLEKKLPFAKFKNFFNFLKLALEKEDDSLLLAVIQASLFKGAHSNFLESSNIAGGVIRYCLKTMRNDNHFIIGFVKHCFRLREKNAVQFDTLFTAILHELILADDVVTWKEVLALPCEPSLWKACFQKRYGNNGTSLLNEACKRGIDTIIDSIDPNPNPDEDDLIDDQANPHQALKRMQFYLNNPSPELNEEDLSELEDCLMRLTISNLPTRLNDYVVFLKEHLPPDHFVDFLRNALMQAIPDDRKRRSTIHVLLSHMEKSTKTNEILTILIQTPHRHDDKIQKMINSLWDASNQKLPSSSPSFAVFAAFNHVDRPLHLNLLPFIATVTVEDPRTFITAFYPIYEYLEASNERNIHQTKSAALKVFKNALCRHFYGNHDLFFESFFEFFNSQDEILVNQDLRACNLRRYQLFFLENLSSVLAKSEEYDNLLSTSEINKILKVLTLYASYQLIPSIRKLLKKVYANNQNLLLEFLKEAKKSEDIEFFISFAKIGLENFAPEIHSQFLELMADLLIEYTEKQNQESLNLFLEKIFPLLNEREFTSVISDEEQYGGSNLLLYALNGNCFSTVPLLVEKCPWIVNVTSWHEYLSQARRLDSDDPKLPFRAFRLKRDGSMQVRNQNINHTPYQSPLSIALEKGHTKSIDYLKSKGAQLVPHALLDSEDKQEIAFKAMNEGNAWKCCIFTTPRENWKIIFKIALSKLKSKDLSPLLHCVTDELSTIEQENELLNIILFQAHRDRRREVVTLLEKDYQKKLETLKTEDFSCLLHFVSDINFTIEQKDEFLNNMLSLVQQCRHHEIIEKLKQIKKTGSITNTTSSSYTSCFFSVPIGEKIPTLSTDTSEGNNDSIRVEGKVSNLQELYEFCVDVITKYPELSLKDTFEKMCADNMAVALDELQQSPNKKECAQGFRFLMESAGLENQKIEILISAWLMLGDGDIGSVDNPSKSEEKPSKRKREEKGKGKEKENEEKMPPAKKVSNNHSDKKRAPFFQIKDSENKSTTLSVSSFAEQLQERNKALHEKYMIKQKREEESEINGQPPLKQARFSSDQPLENQLVEKDEYEGMKEKLKEYLHLLTIETILDIDEFREKFVHHPHSGKALHIVGEVLKPAIRTIEIQLKEWLKQLENDSHEKECIDDILSALDQLELEINEFENNAGHPDKVSYDNYETICKIIDDLMIKIARFCENSFNVISETQEQMKDVTEEGIKCELLDTANEEWKAIIHSSSLSYADYPSVLKQYHIMTFFLENNRLEEIKRVQQIYLNFDSINGREGEASWLDKILKLAIRNNNMSLFSLLTKEVSSELSPTNDQAGETPKPLSGYKIYFKDLPLFGSGENKNPDEQDKQIFRTFGA